MRLLLVARRGSPVIHYAGLANNYASSFCGQLTLTAIDPSKPAAPTEVGAPWWWGSPTQAADARVLDRRRLCAACLRVFDEWALEVDQAIAIQAEREAQQP